MAGMRELAHRAQQETTSTIVTSNAPSSADAITQLRATLPSDQLIYYVPRRG
jgi:hypothetical protein